jgi:alkaline phosphatase D
MVTMRYWEERNRYRDPSSRREPQQHHHRRRLQQEQDEEGSLLFRHGVASGDPTENSVILWTRITLPTPMLLPKDRRGRNITTMDDDGIEVQYTVATSDTFTDVVASGRAKTSSNQDYTLKIDVNTGLEPYTYYYYKFTYCYPSTSSTNATQQPCVDSITGRTKTAPSAASTSISQLRFAVVSCSSYQWGYFHAYDRISDRATTTSDHIDAVLHLGDYIYEHAPGDFGRVRDHDPPRQCMTLSDYRLRYAQYRQDPSLQRIHQWYPFITTWDDHEFVNAGVKGSFLAPQERERLIEQQKRDAAQAYREWLPFRPRINFFDDRVAEEGTSAEDSDDMYLARQQPWQFDLYRKLEYGSLVDIFVLDNRIAGRDEAESFDGQAMFVPHYYDKDRNMLGAPQMEWLKDHLQASQAQWKIIAQTVVMAPLTYRGLVAHNSDAWDGYYADRAELLGFIEERDIQNVVVLSGDIHSHAVNELPQERTRDVSRLRDWWQLQKAAGAKQRFNYTSVAVEFVVTSVSAATIFQDETLLRIIPFALEALDFVLQTIGGRWLNPHNLYLNTLDRGYQILDVQPDRVQADIYVTGDPADPVDALPADQQYQLSFVTQAGTHTAQQTNQESRPLLSNT